MLDVVAHHVGPNFATNYFSFVKSEYFHQPLCFIKDYDNQTAVRKRITKKRFFCILLN